MDDKIGDKTVKSVCDPKKASGKWTRTLGVRDLVRDTEKNIVCESLRRHLYGREKITPG